MEQLFVGIFNKLTDLELADFLLGFQDLMQNDDKNVVSDIYNALSSEISERKKV